MVCVPLILEILHDVPKSMKTLFPKPNNQTPCPESYPTPESNPTPQSKTKKTRRPWKRYEEETLMRAYIDVSEDPIVGNAQPSGIFLLLLLFIVFIVIIFIYVNVDDFFEKSREPLLQHYGRTRLSIKSSNIHQMYQLKNEGNSFCRHLQQVVPF